MSARVKWDLSRLEQRAQFAGLSNIEAKMELVHR